MSIEQEVVEFKRGLLGRRLVKITDPQRQFFDRIYPNGVPNNKLETAIDLCDRTIKKNQES